MAVVVSAVWWTASLAKADEEWSPQVRVRRVQNSDLDQPPFVPPVIQGGVPAAPPLFPPPQEPQADIGRLREMNTPRSGTNTIAPIPPPTGVLPKGRTAAAPSPIDGGVPLLQAVDESPRFERWERPLVMPARAPESMTLGLFAMVRKDGRVGRVRSASEMADGVHTDGESEAARYLLMHLMANASFKPALRAGKPVDCWVAVELARAPH